jgi:hypothetical protein
MTAERATVWVRDSPDAVDKAPKENPYDPVAKPTAAAFRNTDRSMTVTLERTRRP